MNVEYRFLIYRSSKLKCTENGINIKNVEGSEALERQIPAKD